MDLLPNALIDSQQNSVRDICIVGAGPGGLVALKMIMDTPQYKEGVWRPIAFEEREKVGGIWVPAPPVDDPPITPLYDSLTTNLPHPLMCYESFPFPPSTPLFPPAKTVETYLDDYASHFNLMPHIRLSTPVLAVHWNSESLKWQVRVSDDEEHTYDLLIVANGHYRVPRFPDTPGIDAWVAKGKATHSAWYRRPVNMGNTIMVVGGGPSGKDISAEMRGAAHVVIHSATNSAPEDIDDGTQGTLKRRGRVAEFLDVDEGRVLFQDGSIETGVDHCILATGFKHNHPYLPPELLRAAVPPPVPPLPSTFYNSTYHLFPLARHLFPLTPTFPPERAVFLGLLKGIAPLPLMEAQMFAALKIFERPELLDPTQEAVGVVTRYEHLRQRMGDSDIHIASAWHVFAPQAQYDYRDELHALVGDDESRVATWVRDMYDQRDVLRAEWRDLERRGEANDWVRGVGEGGTKEWVELMQKLLKRADERKTKEEAGDRKAKL
ncbi:uncharacterized protein FIBRA_07087 [Fibroporia radiculosa]|uniref:FAD/NAD(P)-binding domain-containing protein n=1 Tax=Fibroporia radiculosa TaxID=599839 RepID=J4IBL9_9APHY|nr:uncharacterized protein FIBRA_07087 [Fibroporia radiculosa]CCM04891.1 predicted protein [Fibroporia radiculosa]